MKYEAIGETIKDLGVKLNMKYSSIQKESDNIIKLLSECFKKYEVDLLNLRYDLSEKEVMNISEISRDACNYHENGVVVLL